MNKGRPNFSCCSICVFVLILNKLIRKWIVIYVLSLFIPMFWVQKYFGSLLKTSSRLPQDFSSTLKWSAERAQTFLCLLALLSNLPVIYSVESTEYLELISWVEIRLIFLPNRISKMSTKNLRFHSGWNTKVCAHEDLLLEYRLSLPLSSYIICAL